MSRKPENVFIAWVHRHLPEGVYGEKTNNPFRRGMADVYYESDGGILWVEYKWCPNKKFPDPLDLSDPNRFLSREQQLWLAGRHANNIPTAVIVGGPPGVVVAPGDSWKKPFSPHVMTRNEFLAWFTKLLTP